MTTVARRRRAPRLTGVRPRGGRRAARDVRAVVTFDAEATMAADYGRTPPDPIEATHEARAGNEELAPGQASAGGDVEPDPIRDLGAPHDQTRPDRLDLPGHPVPEGDAGREPGAERPAERSGVPVARPPGRGER